jgi:hypothetical protein
MSDFIFPEVKWEGCAGTCGKEFLAGYLCRRHMLCNECHEGVDIRS